MKVNSHRPGSTGSPDGTSVAETPPRPTPAEEALVSAGPPPGGAATAAEALVDIFGMALAAGFGLELEEAAEAPVVSAGSAASAAASNGRSLSAASGFSHGSTKDGSGPKKAYARELTGTKQSDAFGHNTCYLSGLRPLCDASCCRRPVVFACYRRACSYRE